MRSKLLSSIVNDYYSYSLNQCSLIVHISHAKPSYECHNLLFLCYEVLFNSAGKFLTTIPQLSQALLDLEAPADLKPVSWVPPVTASFPHSISIVTERDK